MNARWSSLQRCASNPGGSKTPNKLLRLLTALLLSGAATTLQAASSLLDAYNDARANDPVLGAAAPGNV